MSTTDTTVDESVELPVDEAVELSGDAGLDAEESAESTETPAAEVETKKTGRPWYVRAVVTMLALFAAWHIFANFLWIAPPSPLRLVIPGDTLTRYMIPMFGQSWSVFAPEPINGDYRFRVRAVVNESAGPRTTEWVDATAVEFSMLTHNFFPPRGAIQAGEVASDYKGAWEKLNDEQKAVGALGFYKGADWEKRLVTALGKGKAADGFARAEHLATAYSTQVAYAVWGDNIESVQFEATRQNVIPFPKRHDPHAERPGIQYVPSGWRGLIEEEGQSREQFRKVFRQAMVESGQ